MKTQAGRLATTLTLLALCLAAAGCQEVIAAEAFQPAAFAHGVRQ